jgi:hypothetical protein
MRRLFSMVCLGFALLNIDSALAQEKPLVVLRFNQPHVYYEQPLYEAISQAVTVKPAVTFDVVSYAPQTGNGGTDAAWQATASHNTQAVVSAMNRMGVPSSRIRVSGARDASINYDEVHIFAR